MQPLVEDAAPRGFRLLAHQYGQGAGGRKLRRVLLVAVLAAAATTGPAPSRTALFGILLAVAAAAWLTWTLPSLGPRATFACLLVIGIAGGLLPAAASARAFAVPATLVCVAAAAAGERLRSASAMVVAAASLTAVLAATVAVPQRTIDALAAAAIVTGLAFGLARREYVLRADRAEALLAEVEQARAQQARAAVLGERLRVAREVHDLLAHSLGAMAIQLETAEALLADGRHADGALDAVRRTRGLAVEGLEETRRAVAALRGDGRALPELLRELTAARPDSPGPMPAVAIRGEVRALPEEAVLALRRIAQEALTNARRHAPGADVGVDLEFGADAVVLRVVNEAPATRGAAAGGYGIVGMRERAGLVGGTLIASRQGDRFVVEARVPA